MSDELFKQHVLNKLDLLEKENLHLKKELEEQNKQINNLEVQLAQNQSCRDLETKKNV